MAEDRIAFLKSRSIALCTAESCTGGLIASRITDLSGSSEVLWGSFVAYDNSAKVALGVPEKTIARHGAVSREVAEALATAALEKMKTALATPSANIRAPRSLASIATTGIAGPTGGTAEKPVGLCWIAVAISENGAAPRVFSREIRTSLSNTRAQNKSEFAEEAWLLLTDSLNPTEN